MILGLIPARSGSKGVRNKNIRLLGGKPLIVYAVECGLACPSIDHIVISTDSKYNAEIGKQHGAEVPFIRPKELAKDDTPMLPVLQHALKVCEKYYGQVIEMIVLLDPTSPFRTPKDIEEAIKLFLEEPDCDAIISGHPAHRNPYFNMIQIENDYARLVVESEKEIGTRQKCPPVFDLDTTVWIYSRRALLEERRRLPKKTKLFLIQEQRLFDIDSEWDFKIAELLLTQRG